MPRQGYKNLRIASTVYEYANEKRTEIEDEIGLHPEWDAVVRAGLDDLEKHPRNLDSVDSQRNYKNLSVDAELFDTGLERREEIGQEIGTDVSWNHVVEAGADALYYRFVERGLTEDEVLEMIREEIDKRVVDGALKRL